TANVAWTLGVQVGPKLPVTNNAQGVGVEGLLLLGCRYHSAHYVLNLGGLRDPATDGPHPSGPEMGIDIDQPLDDAEHLSLKAHIGAVVYVSPDPDQLTLASGIAWQVTDNLEVSLIGLYGALHGGDQWGVLFGVSPKFRLW